MQVATLYIQVASSLYPPRSVANIFGIWLHDVLDHKDTLSVHKRVYICSF
jgi:hypothetical protein